jgi:hypothetical protein
MVWQPGQSGNPDGGWARKPIRDAISMELAMMEQGKLDPIPPLCARAMVRAQIEKACKGDSLAFNAIADRSDGKPRQYGICTSPPELSRQTRSIGFSGYRAGPSKPLI